MAFKTFVEQVTEHINFLRENGLHVETLEIGCGSVRCHAIGETEGRGDYAYRTRKNPMNKPNTVGLVTWCRVPGGVELKHSSYGLDGEVAGIKVQSVVGKSEPAKAGHSEEVGKKARYLWSQAKEVGRSDYLERKGVGAYGIRFLENTYGRVALIPLADGGDILRGLQYLNPDGFKPFLSGSVLSSLFHKLSEPKNGQDIGIGESYVTSATCLELSGIPVVCAFSASNLLAVAKEIRLRYPNSRIIFFADNDRHLEKNVGVESAIKAMKELGTNSLLAVPDFGNTPQGKDASDWNDLVRVKGKEAAQKQIESEP